MTHKAVNKLWLIVALAVWLPKGIDALDLNYSGRIVDEKGSPSPGPLDLIVRFFGSATGNDQLDKELQFYKVPVVDGVFQIPLTLDAAAQAAVFGDGTRQVFIEVEALGKVYPRQSFAPVPLALRIPIDTEQFEFAGAASQLTLRSIEIEQVSGLRDALDHAAMPASIADNKLATITSAGKVAGSAITAGTITGAAGFAGSGGVNTTGSIVSSGHIVVHGTGNASTELRFTDQDGSNYLGFKAPKTITTNHIWTLPDADGSPGSILKTDGNGNLAWITAGGGGDLYADNNLSDLRNKNTARTNLGLGSIATQSAIDSLTIVNGTLTDEDIAGDANIATSKLSGSLLSVPGHGLGPLASKTSLDSNEISDLTILNADISSSAGIATTKLSGTLWNVANHGLGTLSTLSEISSAQIAEESIVNVDIAPLANISDSKLAVITTPGKVSGNAIISGTIEGTASFAGSGGVNTSGPIVTNAGVDVRGSSGTAKNLRFYDAENSHYVGLKAAASLANTTTWTLPLSDGSAGQVLKTDGSGALSWASGLAPTGAAGGDLTGSFPTPILTDTGVTAGTYPKVQVNAQGRVIQGVATISSQDIEDASIQNADIANESGISTTKLSGTAFAITNHGLGALASISSISSTLIDPSAIKNVHISSSAAIETSKLSGSLLAITANGLGALATKSSITNVDIVSSAAIDADKIADGTVSSTEFQYLRNITSDVQTQLDAKANAANPSFTGVMSVALGSAAAPSYAFNGDTNTGIWSAAADRLSFGTGGSERVTMTETGNVGIGTTAPGATLDVLPAGGKDVMLGGGGTTGSELKLTNSGTSHFSIYNSGNNNLTFANTSGNFNSNWPGVAMMSISNNGHVGIGTTTPAGLLDVNGKLTVLSDGKVGIGTTSPTSGLHINTNPANNESLLSVGSAYGSTTNDNGLHLYAYSDGSNYFDSKTETNGKTYFRTGHGTEQSFGRTWMTVDAGSGNVGIGTTSPSAQLEVAGIVTTSNVSGTVKSGLNVSSGNFLSIEAFNGNNTLKYPVVIAAYGGNVGIGTTNPQAKMVIHGGQVAINIPSTLTPTQITQTVDWNNGNVQTINLASAPGNVTLSFDNPVTGATYALKVVQGANSRNLLWPSNVKWPSGTAIAISTANNAMDFVTLFYDGTNYLAFGGKDFR